MARHYLGPLFSPQSVTVSGAGNRPRSFGGPVFANLLTGGATGASSERSIPRRGQSFFSISGR